MASVTSTVPGAITALLGYMNTVASNNPALNIGVYLGEPISNVNDNFMAVGSFVDWSPVAPETYKWAAIPGSAKLRSEEYSLQGVVRSLSGNSTDQDKLDRLNDVFTILNALHEEILNDYFASGALSGPGAWGELRVTMEAFGPLGGVGFGAVLGFELEVVNAQLAG